jgi:phosphatidylserine/phosphatidylglycerophosphate/cardiolipin synthase-like enzyme
MGLDLGSVEFYAGPSVLGGPDDLETVIHDFIAGANKTLRIAVQEIDSRTIADAVLAAKAAGLRVQIVLEGGYLLEEPASADPWLLAGDNEMNRVIHAAFLRAGVDVITDLNPEIFHQKFIVRDAGLPTAAVLTGSTNFTLTDTGRNPDPPVVPGVTGNNLNHVVVLHGQRVADQYLAEFERLRSGTFGDLHERHEPKPAEFRLGKIRVKPLFAPQHGPEMEIMKQMLKAKKRIDFAMFTFSQSSGIDDTMICRVASLDRIRGVLDRGQGAQAWAATQPLADAGVELFQNKPGTGVRKVHHKLMVIDDRIVVAGSFNYTAPANEYNDENLFILGSPHVEVEGVEVEVDPVRDLGVHARAEIQRLFALSEPFVPV